MYISVLVRGCSIVSRLHVTPLNIANKYTLSNRKTINAECPERENITHQLTLASRNAKTATHPMHRINHAVLAKWISFNVRFDDTAQIPYTSML